MDDTGRRGWHIDKGIPIAVILALLGIAYAGVQRLSAQDERISKVELSVQYIQQSRVIDQGRTEKKFDELKTDLRTINSKLDRIIESDR
ncbi:hypothetical protein MIH18_23715 (plasmid) [Marinobacter sp. M3C]|jgi:outer membrane murein-binding lipoprotein Lpp|uniref:hypothetical protein n=1 Tax=Marinobacter sp. M3C TaxID=2917715 RepID=UPI00200D0ADF|nr:hypothetical protein [Marinobacter sp. M3C]MCL1485136.1 hypothetical protein [Marinobacter sp.]UQG62840.1 hypothetical protein MIH18_23715 [Marinobacter sp. M3C]